MTHFSIRDARRTDLPFLKSIIDKVELFPSDFLDEMTASYFDGNPNHEIWRVAENDSIIAFVYCAAERMTQGTENLLLLAVAPEDRRKGVGAALTKDIERAAREKGAHLLLVETSTLEAFQGPRQFYTKMGFKELARIAEYYKLGEGKVIFGKALVDGGQK
jgi:ribosomal protein S18 acetylase RimI-like enzyme